jgi:replicative DNA helicase
MTATNMRPNSYFQMSRIFSKGLCHGFYCVFDNPRQHSFPTCMTYANIVADKALKRRLMASAEEIAQAAYEDKEGEECLDLAEQALLKVSANKRQRNIEPVNSIVREVIELLGQERKGDLVGIPTQFKMLDRILGGLQKSDLIYVAGRPGMGKSSWGLGVAKGAAQLGFKSAFFSLEMSKRQLVERMISMDTGIDTNRLRTRRLLSLHGDRQQLRQRSRGLAELHPEDQQLDPRHQDCLRDGERARHLRPAGHRDVRV